MAQAAEPYGEVTFLDGWRLPDGTYQTAIDFDLSEGWKTYWRTPGPAGIPPFFDWGGSTNIADVDIQWPTPHVSESYGLLSIGYTGRLTIPVRITPINSDAPVKVELNMEFGVCSDICVPADARFNTILGNHTDDGVAEIRTALKDGPVSAESAGLGTATCALTPNGNGFDIQASLRFAKPQTGQPVTVIEYADPDIWIDIAETSVNGRDLTANATLEYYGNGMLTIDRSNILITVFEDGRAVEFNGCPAS